MNIISELVIDTEVRAWKQKCIYIGTGRSVSPNFHTTAMYSKSLPLKIKIGVSTNTHNLALSHTAERNNFKLVANIER
jgi:ribosomal protein L28